MKNNNYKIVILVVILTLSIIYFYLSKQDFFTSNYSENFIFNTSKGRVLHIKASKNNFKIEELKGKIIFLKVFGWNCQYCQKEIPELIKLKNNFKKAFDVIAVEAQHHSSQENIDLIKKNSINYNIVEGDKQKLFFNYLKENYGWTGIIPMTIVIGTDGKILAFEVGSKSYSLANLLHSTLKLITTQAVERENKGGDIK